VNRCDGHRCLDSDAIWRDAVDNSLRGPQSST
jgi:hypothetical protein